MDHADAGRRYHQVNHIARHVHAKPGAVYLVDRKKDMIITGGENVYEGWR